MSESKRVVIANIKEKTRIFPKGRKVYLVFMPGVADGVWIRAQSRGGRWVSVWVETDYLENARIQTIPLESPIYKYFVSYHGRTTEKVVELINETEKGSEEWDRIDSKPTV